MQTGRGKGIRHRKGKPCKEEVKVEGKAEEKGEDQLSSYFINIEKVPQPFKKRKAGSGVCRSTCNRRKMETQMGSLHGERRGQKAGPLLSRGVHAYLHMQA